MSVCTAERFINDVFVYWVLFHIFLPHHFMFMFRELHCLSFSMIRHLSQNCLEAISEQGAPHKGRTLAAWIAFNRKQNVTDGHRVSRPEIVLLTHATLLRNSFVQRRSKGFSLCFFPETHNSISFSVKERGGWICLLWIMTKLCSMLFSHRIIFPISHPLKIV